MYTPNNLQRCQRLVCSRKHSIIFISAVICIIVAIAAIAALAHPSRPYYGCTSGAAAANGSADDKSLSVKPLLSTTGKLFPWTSIRLPAAFKPVSYELFIHPNLSTFHFDGNVTITFIVSTTTNFMLFHVKTLNITSYELFETSVGGRTGDRVKVVEALECIKLELFHLKLASNILPNRLYQLRVVYSGMLTDSLTGFYRSSYETQSGEKRYIRYF